ELIGLDASQFADVDAGFFRYAVADAVATHVLYPALAQAAEELMIEQGWTQDAARFDIRPDAIQKFGYLSETVQVKASIVLSHMFRRGVAVDRRKVQALAQKHRAELASITEVLQRDHPQVLRKTKDNTLALTPKGQTPSLGNKELTTMLEKGAEAIQAPGHTII